MGELPDDYDVSLSVDVGLLVPLLKVIDQQIEKVEARFANNPSDGDTFGWFDDLEALAGLGFVACQQLLARTYKRYGDGKRRLFEKGPRHTSGVSYAQVVDAAANFWKHEGEWVTGKEDEPESRTRKVLEKLARTREPYVLANVLHALLQPEQARFARLLPWLEKWVSALATDGVTP